MTLHNRLLLTYGYLVFLVILGAVSAAFGFRDLGASIGGVLGQNFESVRASTGMLEGLERQDSAMLALLMDKANARRSLEEAEAAFRDALAHAERSISIAQEQAILTSIAGDFETYRRARDELIQNTPDRPLEQYERLVYPAFDAVKTGILALIDVNHDAMVRADEQAMRSATTRAALHALLVAAAVVSLAPLARMLRRDVLGRIRELSDVAQAIAGGDARRRATIDHNDELGMVARQLNSVLDQVQQARSEAGGRLARERRLLRAVVSSLGAPAALAAADGQLIVDTLAPEMRRQLVPLIQHHCRADVAREVDLETPAGRFTLRPLEPDGGALLGWLVVMAPRTP